ncbi:MAG TPA: hypothetical protein P5519_01080 [Spirochaetia bacterium]|nr:hypothetical protein [Spirochaetales bacterium]HRS64464.1 hypothetical protein [Spirochaetia bacterium]HRV27318.1 hypothetical protein [Spirochaetia bacterium]
MVKKLSIALTMVMLFMQTGCNLAVLNNNSYGKFLASYITPGIKAQVQLDADCSFLAIDPDSDGIYVVHSNNTITYYDRDLKKIGTYTFTGYSADFGFSRFPAASKNIGSGRISMVPYNRLQWIILFGDTKTFVEKRPAIQVPENFVHAVQENATKPFSINDEPLWFSNTGSLWQGTNNYQHNFSNMPHRVYTNGSTLYALIIESITPHYDTNTEIYSIKLSSNDFNTEANSLDSTAVADGLLRFSLEIPMDLQPQYLYVNDIFIAVIASRNDGDYPTICTLLSRSTGRTILVLAHNNHPEIGHYGFSATRIYYEKMWQLYAIEVKP